MENLTREQAYDSCERMMSGSEKDSVVAETLVALNEKGETAEEVIGFTRCLLDHALKIPYEVGTIDLCGTGGSTGSRFNVSTAAAFVVSAIGGKVAKHGNRGSKNPNGSFDFLEALDVPVDLNGAALANLLDKTNLAFIYARKFHPVMSTVAAARKIANRRTIFNLAGPLSNPTKVKHQVIGTVDTAFSTILMEAALSLGRERVTVVSGHEGIDELSVSGPSSILKSWEQKQGKQIWEPSAIGLPAITGEEIPSGDAKTNAKIFLDLLEGKAPKSVEDMIAVNAALVLECARLTPTIEEGYKISREIIKTGAAKKQFLKYRELAR